VPYITATIQITSDLGGSPSVLYQKIRRIFVTEAQEINLTKSASDPVGGTITGITGGGPTYTVTTTAPHGLTTGQTAIINGVSPAVYNGAWLIAATPLTTTFTFVGVTGAAAWSSGGVVEGIYTTVPTVTQAPVLNALILSNDSGNPINFKLNSAALNDGIIGLKAGGFIVVIDGQIAAGASNNAQVNNPNAAAQISGFAGGT
jgi:hypothetical protein